MQQKISRKCAGLMVFYPILMVFYLMLTGAITQLAFLHPLWARQALDWVAMQTLSNYRFIMVGMWVGLAVVLILAVRFAQELSHLDRERWRARMQHQRS